MKLHSFRARCAMGTAIAGLTMYGYGVRKAYAGDCVTNLGGTLCSGEADPATDTMQIIADPVIVTQDGFGIDTRQTGGNAFNLTNGPGGNTDLVFVDDFESLIAGAVSGIGAVNEEGDASITVTGSVIGETNDGISVINNPGSVDLTVSANEVAGDANGINVSNSGSGATSVVATGTVLGKTGIGVTAINNVNALDLEITVVDVEGASAGVQGFQSGAGDLTITSDGAISATEGYGLVATTAASAGAMNISVRDVAGATYGVFASHEGSGDLSITSSASTISATDGIGIRAFAGVSTAGLNIAANDVTGGAEGILAQNSGAGPLTLTADGDVTASGGTGILAGNYGSADSAYILVGGNVSAGETGVSLLNASAAASMSITVSGDVSAATNNGIYARALDGLDMIIDVGGDIAAGVNGAGVELINSGSGNASINVSGDIGGGDFGIGTSSGVSAGGLVISAGGDVQGEQTGIFTVHNGAGAASISVGGDISAEADDGVSFIAGGNATDATIEVGGNVSSAISTGVYARNNGTGAMSISVGGGVTGGEDGIHAIQFGTGLTIETGDEVSGGQYGVRAFNYAAGALSITTGGDVSGDGAVGISAVNDSAGPMSVTAMGDVSGGSAGMAVYNNGTGALTITASGAVEGGDTGLAARSSGTDMTIAAEGPVSGGQYGVIAVNQGTGAMSVTTSGRVSGGVSGFYIIGEATGTDVTVTADGDVAGAVSGIGVLNDGSGVTTVNIGGAVSGGEIGGVGVNGAENVVNISTSGSVGALSDFAVAANGGSATINNAGTVTGFVQTDAGDDVFVNSSPNSLNLRHFADTDNNGVRETENVAVSDFGAGNDTFVNTGTIRLLTVGDQTGFSAATDDDAAPTAFGTSGVAAYTPLGHAPASLAAAGVEQAHLVNLESFAHSGVITMQDLETGGLRPVAGDVLVITAGATAGVSGGGVFRADGGALRLDTQLDDGVVDVSDVLVVDSTVLGTGATSIFIANAGGVGAPTDVNDNGVVDEGEGIRIVEVLDANNSDPGAFRLGGPAIAGIYAYDLYHGATSGDWFLSSSFAPSAAIYEALPQALFSLNDVPTMRERTGSRNWGFGGDASGLSVPRAQGVTLWGRITGQIRRDVESDVTSFGVGYDVDRWQIETGFDKLMLDREDGKLIAGFSFHFGESSLNLRSDLGAGDIEATGYGAAATLTWHDAGGFYADGRAQFSLTDMDIESDAIGPLGEGEDGQAYALSLEAGQRFELGGAWSVTPQSQLVYGDVGLDDFTDPFGAAVSLEGGDSLTGRLGAALDHEQRGGERSRRHLYALANVYYEFLGESEINVSGTRLRNREDRLTAEVGLGGSMIWGGGRYAAFGQIDAATSFENFGDTYDLRATAGFRFQY